MDDTTETGLVPIGSLARTTISSLERRQRSGGLISATNSQPEREAKAVEISRLALHFWRPDFTPRQVKSVMSDYLDDLAGRSAWEVAEACKAWRRDGANRFFPTPGQLLALMPRPEPPPRQQPYIPPPMTDAAREAKLAAWRKAFGREATQ